MRKHFLVITSMLCWINSYAGWFNSGEQQERDRREHAEQQLNQVEKKNDGMSIVATVLAVTTVVGMGVGAAVGSRTRRDAHQ